MSALPLFDLTGRVALVTGASRGLGLAMAKALALAGAHVVINGRDAASLADSAAHIRAAGGKCDSASFDATDVAACEAAVADIARQHGRIDIVIANAGFVNRASLGDWTPALWDEVLNANLRAAFFLAQSAARVMKAQRSGRIIFTSSITGMRGRATIHGYAASKAGLGSLARSLAAELGEHGITVNTIAPGYFETDLNGPLLRDPAFVERINSRTALKRWGKPDEVAGIALMLASDAGGYVTGQQIVVDGGMTGTM